MIKLEKNGLLDPKGISQLNPFFCLFVFHFSFNVSPVFYVQGIHIFMNQSFRIYDFILLLKQMAQFYIDNCQLKNFFGKKKLFVTFLEIKRTADYSCLTTHISLFNISWILKNPAIHLVFFNC